MVKEMLGPKRVDLLTQHNSQDIVDQFSRKERSRLVTWRGFGRSPSKRLTRGVEMSNRLGPGTVALRAGVAAATSALLASMLLLLVSSPAHAFALHGCEYDNASINPISYRFFSVNSAYETAFKSAEQAWDVTISPGYFSEQSASPDPEINVTDGVYSGTWWAKTSFTCQQTGLYSGNETNVTFDTGDMSGLTAHQKMIVAEHELGHAYGLADVSTGCRVMRQGTYKFSCGLMPASDDINGVNAIY